MSKKINDILAPSADAVLLQALVDPCVAKYNGTHTLGIRGVVAFDEPDERRTKTFIFFFSKISDDEFTDGYILFYLFQSFFHHTGMLDEIACSIELSIFNLVECSLDRTNFYPGFFDKAKGNRKFSVNEFRACFDGKREAC